MIRMLAFFTVWFWSAFNALHSEDVLLSYFSESGFSVVVSTTGRFSITGFARGHFGVEPQSGSNMQNRVLLERQLSPAELNQLTTAFKRINFTAPLNTRQVPAAYGLDAGGYLMIRDPVSGVLRALIQADQKIVWSETEFGPGFSSFLDLQINSSEEAIDTLVAVESLIREIRPQARRLFRPLSIFAGGRFFGFISQEQAQFDLEYPSNLDWSKFDALGMELELFSPNGSGRKISFHALEDGGWTLSFSPKRGGSILYESEVLHFKIGEWQVLSPGRLKIKLIQTDATGSPTPSLLLEIDLMRQFAKVVSVQSVEGISSGVSLLPWFRSMPPGFDGLSTLVASIKSDAPIPRGILSGNPWAETHPTLRGSFDFYEWWQAHESQIPITPLRFLDSHLPGHAYEDNGPMVPFSHGTDIIGPKYVIASFLFSPEGSQYHITSTGRHRGFVPDSCESILKVLRHLARQPKFQISPRE